MAKQNYYDTDFTPSLQKWRMKEWMFTKRYYALKYFAKYII